MTREKLTLVPVRGRAVVDGRSATAGLDGSEELVRAVGSAAGFERAAGLERAAGFERAAGLERAAVASRVGRGAGAARPSTGRPFEDAPEVLETPESQTRVSPRALAASLPHAPVGHMSRLGRESLLRGDWAIIDVSRQDAEVRVLLRPASLSLSAREREVLRGVLMGMPDRNISQLLGITRQCACGHLTSGLAKLGTDSRFPALLVHRTLVEVERGRNGRATVAEVPYGSERLLSLRCPIPPRSEVEVRLSAAETDVAWLITDGLSNREIGLMRGVSERTVANQAGAVFNKLECSRRYEVAQFMLGLR